MDLINQRNLIQVNIIFYIKLSSSQEILLNHLNLQNKGGGAIYKNTNSTMDQFKTDSIKTGQFHITTIDKTNKIVTGIFFFEAFRYCIKDMI